MPHDISLLTEFVTAIVICVSHLSERCQHSDDANVRHVSGQCYWTITNSLNFTEAHKRCQEEGGMLAEIPDQEAHTQIKDFLTYMDNYSDIWIGVNYNKTEKKCVNMLNEAVSCTNGNFNGPDNSNHGSNDDIYCVRISSDGIWHAKSCSKTFPALCSQRHTIVTQTSGQTLTQSTTTYQTTESQTSGQTSTQSTTTYQTTESQTSGQTSTQSTTTYQTTVSQTSRQTTTLSSTRLTTMEQLRETQTSVQTSTQSTDTDQQSVPQTSMQANSSEQSTEDTTASVSQKRECMCPCTRMKNLVIIKNEAELLMKIDNIKKELAVKKSLLSSSIRKRTSAVDLRPSASIVGGTISVVIIATVVGLIVLRDLTRVINFCWKTISKRLNRKTKAAQKEKV